MLLAVSLVSAVLGVVDQTLARFDRDTLQPVGPTLNLIEPHSFPVMAPDGKRFAIGVSHAGTDGIPTTGQGRVGLWIVDAGAMRLERQIRTGIAAEAVVYPGKVAAVLQDGALVVVDPGSGRIITRRQIGFSFGVPGGAQVGTRGVIVNQVHRGHGAEVVVVSAAGTVRRTSVRLPGVARNVALATDGRRAYIVGNRRIAVFDPATLRVTTHRFDGTVTTAAIAGHSLAIGGKRGLRVYDTRTWKLLARDARSEYVFASGRTIVASGGGRVTARDATGRVRWRAKGRAAVVAGGRVYAQPAVLDLATGARVGTHPLSNYQLRLL